MDFLEGLDSISFFKQVRECVSEADNGVELRPTGKRPAELRPLTFSEIYTPYAVRIGILLGFDDHLCRPVRTGHVESAQCQGDRVIAGATSDIQNFVGTGFGQNLLEESVSASFLPSQLINSSHRLTNAGVYCC